MTVLRVLRAASVLVVMAMSNDIAGAANMRDVSVLGRLPSDHPIGAGAIITPVSLERAKNLNDATF
jgi:hypothetical protein